MERMVIILVDDKAWVVSGGLNPDFSYYTIKWHASINLLKPLPYPLTRVSRNKVMDESVCLLLLLFCRWRERTLRKGQKLISITIRGHRT